MQFVFFPEEGFAALASLCVDLKYRLFRLRPKLHLLLHIVTLGIYTHRHRAYKCVPASSCVCKLDHVSYLYSEETYARSNSTGQPMDHVTVECVGCTECPATTYVRQNINFLRGSKLYLRLRLLV